MNPVSRREPISCADLHKLEVDWVKACDKTKVEGRVQRFQIVLSLVQAYIRDNQSRLTVQQVTELNNFYNLLEGVKNKDPVQGIQGKTIPEVAVELRAMGAIYNSDLKVGYPNVCFLQAMKTGEVYVVGKGSRKRIIGRGAYKFVKAGEEEMTRQKIAYSTSRGLDGLKTGKKEFQYLSLFKGCEGIIQVFFEIDTPSTSEKRQDKNKHVMIGELYEADLSHLDIQNLSSEDKRQMAADLGAALFHLKDKGIAHLDIKPNNIFYYTDPVTGLKRLRLGDFGAACEVNTGLDHLTTTYPYCSPQQAGSHYYGFPPLTASHKDDVWAAALTLYKLFINIPKHMLYVSADSNYFFSCRSALKANWVDEDMSTLSQSHKDRIDPQLFELIKRGLDPNANTRISIEEFSKRLCALAPNVFQEQEGGSTQVGEGSSSSGSLGKRKRQED